MTEELLREFEDRKIERARRRYVDARRIAEGVAAAHGGDGLEASVQAQLLAEETRRRGVELSVADARVERAEKRLEAARENAPEKNKEKEQ